MPRSRRIDPDDVVEEEETQEDTRPSRRRRQHEDEEDARPVRRSRARDDDDDEKPVRRSRARDDDDDAEDSDEPSSVIPISRGRREIKKNRPQSEISLLFFRFDEESQLVKFLDTPIWSYDQHWVQREGKRSFPCIGKGCPLCDIGVKAEQKIVYTVLNLTPPKGDKPLVQVMEVGVTLDDTLASYDEDRKTGPLPRLWWSVSRSEGARSTGRGKRYNYSFIPVKDRDLEEDWEIDLDEAETAVDGADIPDSKTILGDWNRSKLQEIADEVMDR